MLVEVVVDVPFLASSLTHVHASNIQSNSSVDRAPLQFCLGDLGSIPSWTVGPNFVLFIITVFAMHMKKTFFNSLRFISIIN